MIKSKLDKILNRIINEDVVNLGEDYNVYSIWENMSHEWIDYNIQPYINMENKIFSVNGVISEDQSFFCRVRIGEDDFADIHFICVSYGEYCLHCHIFASKTSGQVIHLASTIAMEQEMIDVIEDILTDVNNYQISIGCINNPTDEDYYDDFQYEPYKPDWLGGTETEEAFWEHTD